MMQTVFSRTGAGREPGCTVAFRFFSGPSFLKANAECRQQPLHNRGKANQSHKDFE
jgi:hypothetical protein